MQFSRQFTLYLACIFALSLPLGVHAHGPVHESIERLTKSIETYPDSAELYLQRGQFYQMDEDFDHAFSDYNKAKSLHLDNRHVDLQCAKLFLEHNYSESALMYVNKVLAERPKHVDALMTRAAIHTQLMNDDLAVMDFEKAIENIREPRPEHYIAISKATLTADSTNFEDAIEWLKKGEEKIGANIVLGSYAVDLAVLQKDFDKALSMTDVIIVGMKRKEKWLLKKIEILEQAGRFEEAYQTAEQAMEAIRALPRHTRGTRLVTELQAQISLKLIELKQNTPK